MDIFYSEPEKGNLEYKLHLRYFDYNKFQRYSTQLKYRILEGEGEAIYIIGINDNGHVMGLNQYEITETISKFNYVCENVLCKITLVIKSTFKNRVFLIFKVIAKFDIENLPFII